MSQEQKEKLIPEQYGIEKKEEIEVIHLIHCTYCDELIDEEEANSVGPVDDSIDICEACYEHLQ